jgi:hypothetical protein
MADAQFKTFADVNEALQEAMRLNTEIFQQLEYVLVIKVSDVPGHTGTSFFVMFCFAREAERQTEFAC